MRNSLLFHHVFSCSSLTSEFMLRPAKPIRDVVKHSVHIQYKLELLRLGLQRDIYPRLDQCFREDAFDQKWPSLWQSDFDVDTVFEEAILPSPMVTLNTQHRPLPSHLTFDPLQDLAVNLNLVFPYLIVAFATDAEQNLFLWSLSRLHFGGIPIQALSNALPRSANTLFMHPTIILFMLCAILKSAMIVWLFTMT
ncbi:hypothetical protein DEU56DRAFT_41723 [Suillus clintonianus]|uniref:uncharacterized protein n=1 Tax=Suillus clintonianus TaxID=1904413 RepID=UPI001B86D352|nr:uncharacterized protein DEU56DRAFT_41723 [Suillus clintonianus]KAG2124017.1 hypothetical protein DEU56DRAFT_41723 [Suillus clintonianus]